MNPSYRAVFVLVIWIAGCVPSLGTGAGGLRTYGVDHEVLCNLGQQLDPPSGVLRGSPIDPERIWLVSPAGDRISVAWPEGFSVEFTPSAVLRNDRGEVVARDGDTVVLENASDYGGEGSAQRPYPASRAFGGCYPARR